MAIRLRTAHMQFWFLYTLLVISVSHDLLLRVLKSTPLVFAVWALLFVSYQFRFLPLGPWGVAHLAIAYFGYFAIGAFTLSWASSLSQQTSMTLIATSIITGALVTLYVIFGLNVTPYLAPLVAVAGVIMSIAFAHLLARTRSGEVLVLLGQASLLIFVAHTIVSAGVRVFLLRGLKVSDPTIHLIAGDSLGIIVPFLLFLASRKIPALQWSYRLK